MISTDEKVISNFDDQIKKWERFGKKIINLPKKMKRDVENRLDRMVCNLFMVYICVRNII